MKSQNRAFSIILAAVIISGTFFSLYAFSKIKSIHELRAAVKKSGAERDLAIKMASESSTESGKSTPWGAVVPQKMWTAEFIETAYTASRKYGIKDLTFEQKSADSSRRQDRSRISTPVKSYPVRITFHAGYRQMADFIDELQRFERLVTIESLRVKREDISGMSRKLLAIELTASTYTMEGNNAGQ